MGKQLKRDEKIAEFRKKIEECKAYSRVDPNPADRVEQALKNPCGDSLFYVNKALKHALNLDDNYQNLKCYQIMEGLNSPCSFCKSIEGNKKNILTGIRPTKIAYDTMARGKSKLEVLNAFVKDYFVSREKAELIMEIIIKH